MNVCSRYPVNPFLEASYFSNGRPDGEDVVVDDVVQESDVVWGEPIVGQHPRGEDFMSPKPLPSPKEMTDKEYADHCLTHIPYCDGCWYCVSCGVS